ncbi:MAG: 6-methylsalicylate decarboxylase [Gaiellaceae bacterium]|nr:6-methylsalicylate decarboxylase [Gaiellaceae bacterium]
MPSYDFHQHLWPPALIDALRARADPPRLRGSVLQLPSGEWELDLSCHAPEARIAALDRDEIDIAVISCPPTLGLDAELVEAYHDGILEVVAASGGRLLALSCGSVRPGFVGACVGARAMADLDELAPLLTELERCAEPLFVHPGPEPTEPGAPSWWPSVVGYTAQMQAAYAAWLARGAEAWPRLRVLFAILAGGAPIQLERLASRGVDTRAILHDHVYFDTASYGERALELSMATFGVGQLVYGSDWPVMDAEATLRSVRGFGQAVTDAVCRENPARLLQ